MGWSVYYEFAGQTVMRPAVQEGVGNLAAPRIGSVSVTPPWFAVTTLVKSYSRFVMVTLDVANELKALLAIERTEE
jgi:hypothetical protein